MKGPGLADDMPTEEEEMSPEDDLLTEAFEAIKDDDVAGFRSAMREYVHACASGDYGDKEA